MGSCFAQQEKRESSGHQIYADDVIVFIHLDAAEAAAVKAILGIFGDASLD